MKKRFTRGEKWLFVSPLLFLVMAGAVWQWRKSTNFAIELPVSSNVWKLEFSPDNKRLAVFSGESKPLIHKARIYDLESRSKVCELDMLGGSPQNTFFEPVWAPDGRSIASVYMGIAGKNSVVVWDAESGEVKAKYLYRIPLKAVDEAAIQFSPDSKSLISSGERAAAIDALTGQVKSLSTKGFSKKSLAKASEARLGLTTIQETDSKTPRTIGFRVLDAKTKRVLWKPAIRVLNSVEWHGDILCLSDYAKTFANPGQIEERVFLWNGKTHQPRPTPPIPANSGASKWSFNADNSTLAYFNYTPLASTTGEATGTLITWDYLKNRELWRTPINGNVSQLNWTPSGKRLMVQTYGRNSHDVSIENLLMYHLMVFDKSGKLQYQRLTNSNFQSWSSDEKQLAIAEHDVLSGNIADKRVEILRFNE